MIDQQVRAWEVFDLAVLAALRAVPREQFAPTAYAAVAYADTDIPLPHGEVMLAAKWVGRALQALEVKPQEMALVVGAGTGYVAACLARLTSQLLVLECHEDLAAAARTNLAACGAGSVEVQVADGMSLEPVARYDVMFLGGSLPVPDDRFERALRIGGRLFAVVGQAPTMEAWLITRTGDQAWTREALFETVIPALTHARSPSAFQF
jgi:protein-L-isoaspartate(D-aspartate) O-methyltransferase